MEGKVACDCQEKGGKSTLNVTTITSFTLKATPLAQKEVPAVGRVHFLRVHLAVSWGRHDRTWKKNNTGSNPRLLLREETGRKHE